MENGSITNVELYVSELGVKKLKFNLKLPDMEFVVNADVSMSPMPMGMRVVDSEAEVTFKSGEKEMVSLNWSLIFLKFQILLKNLKKRPDSMSGFFLFVTI